MAYVLQYLSAYALRPVPSYALLAVWTEVMPSVSAYARQSIGLRATTRLILCPTTSRSVIRRVRYCCAPPTPCPVPPYAPAYAVLGELRYCLRTARYPAISAPLLPTATAYRYCLDRYRLPLLPTCLPRTEAGARVVPQLQASVAAAAGVNVIQDAKQVAPTRCPLLVYEGATRCPIPSYGVGCYALSGTGVLLRMFYAMSGTEIGHSVQWAWGWKWGKGGWK
eukprot:1131503-Rhodomonas_salina.4